MQWNKHWDLEGQHAFLGASNYHWLNYDQNKLRDVWRNYNAAQIGSRLHNFAKEAIELGIKLPRTKKTLNLYVNDAIAYGMTPEQILWYSNNAFGTADAISFRENHLRIHDLKTGVTPASLKQLEIYAALFCLEYKHKPGEIDIELRLYQSDDVLIEKAEADLILPIMDKIVTFDKLINKFKREEGEL